MATDQEFERTLEGLLMMLVKTAAGPRRGKARALATVTHFLVMQRLGAPSDSARPTVAPTRAIH